MKAPTLDETVRRRIAAWMAARDLSQTALAAAIDQNQAWVSRYLKGLLKADLETLARIAAAFDTTIPALLDVPPATPDTVLLEAYRALTPEQQKIVRAIVLGLSGGDRARARKDKR